MSKPYSQPSGCDTDDVIQMVECAVIQANNWQQEKVDRSFHCCIVVMTEYLLSAH